MSIDQFFTPADACAVAYQSWETSEDIITIGDFACGNGSLLKLAPFPNKKVFGMDIDPHVISELNSSQTDWNLCVGDFLEPKDNATHFLQGLIGSLDLVVLNPPFSCRGGAKYFVQYDGSQVSCSKAIAFLIKSLDFLKENGSLMAILPKSVLRSEKDASALAAIRKYWRVDIKEEFPRTTFQGCFPRSVCVSLRRHIGQIDTLTDSKRNFQGALKASIVRGCIPLHSTSSTGQFKVLHTTNLRSDNPVATINRYSARPGRMVSGTIITIPRVCAPDIRKVRILDIKQPITLSDCVFALFTEDYTQSITLYNQIKENWEWIEARYESTCAPYVTISDIASFLSSFGWWASVTDLTNNIGANSHRASVNHHKATLTTKKQAR